MSTFEIGADELRSTLEQSRNEGDPAGPSAAVAVVFRAGDNGTEALFIQRATKATDPWSGQMAFPGGRRDDTDRDSHHTAERETVEEVGLDLTSATAIGSLTDLDGARSRNGLFVIHAHCYWLDGPPPALNPNYEVADALWVPLAVLGDHDRYIDYYYPVTDSSWPGIQLDDPNQVVWGLTLRFLADLYRRLDIPFSKIATWPGA